MDYGYIKASGIADKVGNLPKNIEVFIVFIIKGSIDSKSKTCSVRLFGQLPNGEIRNEVINDVAWDDLYADERCEKLLNMDDVEVTSTNEGKISKDDLAKKFMLTEEQKLLVKNLQKALRECSEGGLVVTYDCEDYNGLYVFRDDVEIEGYQLDIDDAYEYDENEDECITLPDQAFYKVDECMGMRWCHQPMLFPIDD